MQATNHLDMPREESTTTFHDYLSDKNYRNLVPLALILMWSIVFYFIFLIFDSFVDKEKHARLARELHDREWKKRPIEKTLDNPELEVERQKKEAAEYKYDLEFCAWAHRNLQISFSHSCMCSIWLLQILWYDQDLLNDLMFYVSWDTYLFLTFSCGYFLYDFWDIFSSGHSRRQWVVCVHHWIVLISFTYHLTNVMHIGYTVIGLIMEFNSVFLHFRKLLKFYQFRKDSLIVRENSRLNVITFTIFRFGVLISIYERLARNSHLLMKLYGKSYARIYISVIFILTMMMTVINIVLYKRILEVDVLKKKKKV